MALDYDKLIAHRSPVADIRYGPRDCILYALGLGLGLQPLDPGELQFVFEKGLKAFPTMPVVLGWTNLIVEDDFGIDRRMIVNAGMEVENHSVLAPEGTLVGHQQIEEVVDRGPDSAAILQIKRRLTLPNGAPVATVSTNLLARKHGGFGGKVTEAPAEAKMPDRAPDRRVDVTTPPNLALLYRLNGDMNPLHVDPELAKKVGFERPILHGAATFGIAARAVLTGCADSRPERIKSIAANFRRPVFPGDIVTAELWQDGASVLFQCRVADRDELVLSGGRAELGDG